MKPNASCFSKCKYKCFQFDYTCFKELTRNKTKFDLQYQHIFYSCFSLLISKYINCFILFASVQSFKVLPSRWWTKAATRRVLWKKLVLKGYLRHRTILCHKVALDVKLMIFFIWRENNVSFSRYLYFCVFVKSSDFKICDAIISIGT